MVEDRVTDPRRIAELLASEVTGLSRGSLAHVTVVDADRTVTPGPDGPVAYRIASRPADGTESAGATPTEIGTVRLFEDEIRVAIAHEDGVVDDPRHASVGPDEPRADLTIGTDGSGFRLGIRSGAAVKPAVDAIEAVIVDDPAGEQPD